MERGRREGRSEEQRHILCGAARDESRAEGGRRGLRALQSPSAVSQAPQSPPLAPAAMRRNRQNAGSVLEEWSGQEEGGRAGHRGMHSALWQAVTI